MGVETKQVRVDNWGIYFLQRLQLFFSKTDYCDLTLQFEGNVQLKVHRLVMNACTEYFTYLEKSCPALEESTILMPQSLQADVIVPIVNFMYTGMLEFHPSIFQKLYRAAETMSITVLTKLLEAQMESVIKSSFPQQKRQKTSRQKVAVDTPIPKEFPANIERDPLASSYSRQATITAKRPAQVAPAKSSPVPTAALHEDPPVPVSMAITGRSKVNWRRRQISNSISPQSHHSSTFADVKWKAVTPKDEKPITVLHDNTPRPTRFEWPDEELLPSSSFMDNTFDENISLTSRPLVTKKEEEERAGPSYRYEESRPACGKGDRSRQNSFMSDQDDYRSSYTNEEHEEKPNVAESGGQKRKFESVVKIVSPKRPKLAEKEETAIMAEHTISIKAPQSSKELDHTKIVQEILKKYPNLVKKNKNIKLKIMTKPDTVEGMVNHKIRMQISNSPERAIENVKQQSDEKTGDNNEENKVPLATLPEKKEKTKTKKAGPDGPWTCLGCDDSPEFVLYYLFRKHLSDVHSEKFDSSSCKYCDRKCSSEVTMAYHLHVKHNLKPPAKMNFPKCPKCSFIAITSEKLKNHIGKHTPEAVQCPHCKLGFENKQSLTGHLIFASHQNTRDNRLDCPYCMSKKKILSPASLFNHIKEVHLKEAQRDRIVSLDENMDFEDPDEQELDGEQCEEGEDMEQQREKVNIISNVKVATKSQEEESLEEQQEEQEDSTHNNSEPAEPETIDAQALSNVNVPSTVANNLGLVDIVVLDDNRQYILQQGHHHHHQHQPEAETEFILPQELQNEALLEAAQTELTSTDELVMVLTDQDYHHSNSQNPEQSDNSNIVVLYSHPVEGQEGQYITSQGNLIVNSQTGLLEIRNGAAITTTDGDILVNQEISSENQAESIELIEKELQSNKHMTKQKEYVRNVVNQSKRVAEATNQQNFDKNVVNVNESPQHSQDKASTNKIEDDLVTTHLEEANKNSNQDENKAAENNASFKILTDKDVTDGESQGEPMEVDEDPGLPPIQESVNEELEVNVGSGLPPIQEIANEEQEVESENKEETSKTQEIAQSKEVVEDEGTDVPPEIDSTPINKKSRWNTEENLILNDTASSCESEKSVAEESENNRHSADLENQPELAGFQDEPMEVDGGTKSLKNLDEFNCDQDKNNDKEKQQQDTLTGSISQTDTTSGDPISSEQQEEAAATSEQNKEVESQGEKDDLSSPKDMRSRSEARRELDKSILEDWSEDTDSQYSEKHDTSTEEGADVADDKSKANVSKLMDDWDDEEEGN